MTQQLRAAIYCRISKAKGTKKTQSVEDQERDCRDLCELNGWQVGDVFVDNDISAADPDKARPAYNAMMKALAKGGFDAVVVTMADRLHRQPNELGQFVDAYLETGMTKVATVREGDFDIGNPNGLKNFRDAGSSAEREIGILKIRVKRQKQSLADRGEYAGGRRPYGYRVVTKKQEVAGSPAGLFVDESEAVVIRECATRVIDGESLLSIVRDLNGRAVPTVRGSQWNTTTLRDMLLRPSITGLRVHGGEVIGEAAWEAIIDRPTWQQVTDILTNPERLTPRASWEYPLRGVLKCSVCGRYLSAMPRKGHRAYGCLKMAGGRMTGACGTIFAKADTLEDFVFSQVLPLADAPDLRDALRAAEQGSSDEIAELSRANAEDSAMLSELDTDYYTLRRISRATHLKQSGALRELIEARSAQIATMRGHSVLDRLGGDVVANWPTMTADERKMILQAMVVDIRVKPAVKGCTKFDPDRVDIVWKLSAQAMRVIGDAVREIEAQMVDGMLA